MASHAGLLLTWAVDNGQRSRLLGDAELRIGRGEEADIRIADNTLSTIHCVIRRDGSDWLVQDCQSTNGTWVNGTRIGRATPIGHGDRIKCGSQDLCLSRIEITTCVVSCPKCAQRLRLPESNKGVSVSCPKCREVFPMATLGEEGGKSASLTDTPQSTSFRDNNRDTLLANTASQLEELARYLKSAHPSLLGQAEASARLGHAASHGLTVMVVGPFNVGKSTLLNCILGKELLPADVTPTTAIPTRILFGAVESLCVKTRAGKSVTRNPSALTAIVQASEEGIVEAELRIPESSLKYVELVDSPGLHALDQSHTDSTYSAHESVDAVLWVSTCAQSASAGEANDIKRLTGKLRPFVVANQTDLLTEDDELASVLERMRVRLGFDSATLIGLSSRAALEGLTKNNKKQVRDSGWPQFVDAFFRMFIPTRHAQRFAMMSGEVLRLASSTSEQIIEAMKSLLTSESELRAAEGALLKAREKHEALSKCHGAWSTSSTVLLTISQLDGWQYEGLSSRLDECEQLLSAIKLPDLQGLQHSATITKTSQIASLKEQQAQLFSTITERRAKARTVEAAHIAHSQLETEIHARRAEFVGRQAIFQSLCFRYRKRIEEDELTANRERRVLDQQIAVAEAEVKNFIQQTTSVGNAVTNLVNSERSVADSERTKSKQNLDEAESRRVAAQHEVSIRAWARSARDKFEDDLRLKLLAALAQDFAQAQPHLA